MIGLVAGEEGGQKSFAGAFSGAFILGKSIHRDENLKVYS